MPTEYLRPASINARQVTGQHRDEVLHPLGEILDDDLDRDMRIGTFHHGQRQEGREDHVELRNNRNCTR